MQNFSFRKYKFISFTLTTCAFLTSIFFACKKEVVKDDTPPATVATAGISPSPIIVVITATEVPTVQVTAPVVTTLTLEQQLNGINIVFDKGVTSEQGLAVKQHLAQVIMGNIQYEYPLDIKDIAVPSQVLIKLKASAIDNSMPNPNAYYYKSSNTSTATNVASALINVIGAFGGNPNLASTNAQMDPLIIVTDANENDISAALMYKGGVSKTSNIKFKSDGSTTLNKINTISTHINNIFTRLNQNNSVATSNIIKPAFVTVTSKISSKFQFLTSDASLKIKADATENEVFEALKAVPGNTFLNTFLNASSIIMTNTTK